MRGVGARAHSTPLLLLGSLPSSETECGRNSGCQFDHGRAYGADNRAPSQEQADADKKGCINDPMA